jgi:hypothetical protein
VCVCVCVCVCVYTIYVCTHTHTHVYLHTHTGARPVEKQAGHYLFPAAYGGQSTLSNVYSL